MANPIFLDITSKDVSVELITDRCRHYELCGMPSHQHSTDQSCILHSHAEDKNLQEFSLALAEHRREHGDVFQYMVFPDGTDFGGVRFNKRTSFYGAKFLGGVDFSDAVFAGDVDFTNATFMKRGSFFSTTFSGRAIFDRVRFIDGTAYFGNASFMGQASFDRTRFKRGALFDKARFAAGATFIGGQLEEGHSTPIFAGTSVYFRSVVTDAQAPISFIDADLRLCRFLDSEVGEMRFLRVLWPSGMDRLAVYDEIGPQEQVPENRLTQLRQLYASLHRNYAKSLDIETANAFHKAECELRRSDPATPLQSRMLLACYGLVSDYGISALRPLLWLTGLLLFGSLVHASCGLVPTLAGNSDAHLVHQLQLSLLYSLHTTFWLGSETLAHATGFGRWMAILQQVGGLALLVSSALAVRRQLSH